jgi:nitroimidazol reductase NimA-like FMN-containing flavoprotein (pyridoxamine 5'-phosphate oxidase superfamily)
MLGQLSENQIEEVLREQLVGRIGCHANGRTYVVPISYAYKENCIYCCAQEGMKVVMMRANPSVCFEVDTMHNMGNWESVIAWGRFEELTVEPERRNALTLLYNRRLPVISSATTRLAPEWPFTPQDIDSIKGVVFRICLDTKTGRFEQTNMPPSFT